MNRLRRPRRGPAYLCVLALSCGGRTELEIGALTLEPVEPGPVCGDGVVEGIEQCDLGDDNGDRPALLLEQRGLTRPVMPLDRNRSATSFYSYTSESSHTGFEEALLSGMLMFRDTRTEVLSLVMFHGIDEDSSGITLEHGLVDLDLDGLPPGVFIELSDEGNELFFTGPGSARGEWEFWRNTDGGVLTGFPFPGSWSVTLRIELRDGIREWSHFDADGEEIDLDPDLDAVLTAFDRPSACRADCTVPRCGDGFVDGGEICDDGNTAAGDGCAADCLSLSN